MEDDLRECAKKGLEVCREGNVREGTEQGIEGSDEGTKEFLEDRLGHGMEEGLRECTGEPTEGDARERGETREHDNTVVLIDLTRDEEHEKVNQFPVFSTTVSCINLIQVRSVT